MQHKPIPPVVLAAALNACAVQPELLNSERIEQRFGSYGIEVLAQDASGRRCSLFSTENGEQTCRTYAIVQFVDPAIAELGAAHTAVLSGQSIGTTFKATGRKISKTTIHVGQVAVVAQHAIGQFMHLNVPADLGLHAYRLMLEQDSQSIHYATIVEAHHPSYLNRSELLELYPMDTVSGLQPDEIQMLLDLVLQQKQIGHPAFVASIQYD